MDFKIIALSKLFYKPPIGHNFIEKSILKNCLTLPNLI